MADTPLTRLYRIVTDCVNAETDAVHTAGERLHLSPDSVLVQAGCAVLAKAEPAPDDDAPKPRRKA